jgi:diacylglycerol kinase (ATP)
MEKLPGLAHIKRYLFVINPIAGERNKNDYEKIIREEIDGLGPEYQLFYTTGKKDAEAIRELLKSYDPEVVMAVGGDGTVNMVAEILAGSKRALGILPSGSGNGFAKDMQIPQNNLRNALDMLLHGQIIEIDTLQANEYFFMHLADIGFNAHIVKLFNKSNSRGLKTYVKFVLKEFFKYPTNYYEVETDNGNFRGNAFMITAANSNQFGSNLTINPDGKCNDGKFEVIIIKRFPKKQALAVFWRLLTKKIKFSPHCIILKCTHATVRCAKKKSLQYDGEVAKRKVKEVDFSLQHKNLRIIIP